MSNVLTVAESGTWAETVTLTVNGAQQVVSDGGTWTRAGASVTLSTNGTAAYRGTFTGAGFSFGDGVYTYAFAK
ncbi:MAG: hypothetical protein ABJE47_16175 [bacterium]